MSTLDKFDDAHCAKLTESILNAIADVAHQPLGGCSVIRNREAYSALVNVMALMLATSRASSDVTEKTAKQLQKELLKRMDWARGAMQGFTIVGRNDVH